MIQKGALGVMGHSPVWPSIDSLIKSAWPRCRQYSSIMWTRIHRRVKVSPVCGLMRTRLLVEPTASESVVDHRVRTAYGLVEKRS